MTIMSRIADQRRNYIKHHGKQPKSIGISFLMGVNLIGAIIDNIPKPNNELKELLIEGDREKITEHLNSMTLYGMKLTVVDMVVS